MPETAFEVAPTLPAVRVRRPTIEPGLRADVLVTRRGRLRIAPLLAAMTREIAPGAAPAVRRHTGLDIVCLVLGGALRYEPVRGAATTLWAEQVAVLSTGAGVEYGWRAIGDTPAHVVMLWLLGRGDGTPKIDVRAASRFERLGTLAPIAGRASALPTSGNVTVMAGVLPVGASLVHAARGKRYVMSTIGAFAADGIAANAGDGVLIDRTGAIRISAKESTEVVIVEPT